MYAIKMRKKWIHIVNTISDVYREHVYLTLSWVINTKQWSFGDFNHYIDKYYYGINGVFYCIV